MPQTPLQKIFLTESSREVDDFIRLTKTQVTADYRYFGLIFDII